MTPNSELITMEPVPALNGASRDRLLSLSKAVAADLRGNPSEALEYLAHIQPGEYFAESLAARSQLRMELKQFAAAALDLEQLSALRPADAQVYLQWGICLYHLSHFEKSLDVLRTASSLNPQ